MRDEKLIGKHGGYRKLKSYQVAELIYDVTVRFCEKYIDKFSRTKDQMVQAARSGVRNIAEGSHASATSKATEMKLTNVARASIEELRGDYEAFLRQKGAEVWQRDDVRRQELIDGRPKNVDDFGKWVKNTYEDGRGTGAKSARRCSYSEISANGAIALIAVASTLLGRQLETQAATFEQEGGFSERAYRVRTRRRRQV